MARASRSPGCIAVWRRPSSPTFNAEAKNEAPFGLGTFAMIDKWTNPTQKSASISDPELDRLVGAVLAETDREKVNNLMRAIFQRLRSEHLGIPLVYLHSAYATSKNAARWNPGAVMYDLNIDELTRQR